MHLTCPSCGADMDLDVALAHEESRQAIAMLLVVGVPLGKLVLQYLRLFKPATRALSLKRFVALLEALLPDLQRGAINHKGREWAVPRETWVAGMERMVEGRDKLKLPMASHAYLYEIMLGLADKVEAHAERDTEALRRARVQGGDLQPTAAVLQPAAAVALPVAYSGPSRHALKVQAEIEAKRRPREEPAA